MISTLLDRLFQRSNVPSGAQVKQRLKFILAHDRAAIEPKVFENMRHEIMRVVSKYVELDEGALDIRLESDKRMTALIANLPIRMVREEMPDLDALFGESPDEANSVVEAEQSSAVLEMDRSAEEALDAIAAKRIIKLVAENSDRVINIPDNSKDDGNLTQSSIHPVIKDNRASEDQSSDQMELLLELERLHPSESQEVVIDESPELYHQSKQQG